MPNETENKRVRSLWGNMAGSLACELAADIVEPFVDLLFDEGVLKEIPILGAGIKVAGAASSVSDGLLLRKLRKFLEPVGKVPQEQRRAFADKVNGSPDFRTKIGEQIIVIVARLDDIEKSDFLGWLFTQVVIERLSYNKFREMAMAIDRCFFDDFNHLELDAGYGPAHYGPSVASRLIGCGMLEIYSIPTIKAGDAPNKYRLTDLGTNLGTLYKEYLELLNN